MVARIHSKIRDGLLTRIRQLGLGTPILAFPVRDASIFVITALQIFSGIREDGASR